MEWIYRCTHVLNATISVLYQIKYFMVPLEVIHKHTGCKFNPAKSKLQSLSIGFVYKYIYNKELEGAYNSLVDTKVHTNIVLYSHFEGY